MLTRNQEVYWEKMTIVEDVLNLKGKGGCYYLMPYESTDDSNKALFKIGMTTDFSNRLKNYHTSFPEGVYFVAFLVDPPIDIWDNDKIVEWKNNADNKNKAKRDVMKAMKEEKYKKLKNSCFRLLLMMMEDVYIQLRTSKFQAIIRKVKLNGFILISI